MGGWVCTASFRQLNLRLARTVHGSAAAVDGGVSHLDFYNHHRNGKSVPVRPQSRKSSQFYFQDFPCVFRSEKKLILRQRRNPVSKIKSGVSARRSGGNVTSGRTTPSDCHWDYPRQLWCLRSMPGLLWYFLEESVAGTIWSTACSSRRI